MRPGTIEEAAALVAEASASGRRIRIGEDLVTDGLDRVLEHEAGDLTCTVEAGIRLSALQAALARAGQRLSLDPPGDPTVGACLAGRLSGPLSHRFGTPRDLVLGVTLVLGDGTVASSGGKVVKNVAGYDLGKLVCGSEGGSRSSRASRCASIRSRPPRRRSWSRPTTRPASCARCGARSSSRAPSTSSIRDASPCSSKDARAPSPRRWTPHARSSAVLRGDASVWDEARGRQARALGRLAFAPGDLGNVLSTLREAVVRPAAGIAYVPHRVGGVPPAAARRLHRALKARLDPEGVLT